MLTVMERLYMHWEAAKSVVPEEQIVGVFLRGSQNYGLDNPTSDVDSLCLVVPSVRDVAMMRPPVAKEIKVGTDGGHVTLMDIREFVKQIRRQNPNILEVLFTKFMLRGEGFGLNFYQLYAKREELARYDRYAMVQSTLGVALTEHKRMKRNGYTHKQLALLLRLRKLMGDYICDKTFADCLWVGEDSFIKKVKNDLVVEDPAEGMQLAQETIDCMKKWMDQCQYLYDKPDESLVEMLYEVQYNFCADHWEWELNKDD